MKVRDHFDEIRIYTFFNKVTFACRPGLFKSAIKFYDPFTLKKKLIYYFLNLISVLQAQHIFLVKIKNQESCFHGGILTPELRKLSSIWNIDKYEHIIYLPPQIERSRRYIHLLENMRPCYFAKIVATNIGCENIEREYEAIIYCKKNIKIFKVPDPIAIYKDKSFCALLQSSIGYGRPPLGSDKIGALISIATEIAEREVSIITPSELRELFWLKKFYSFKCKQSKKFDESLELEIHDLNGVRVNMVHGDIGFHNIKKHDNSLIVYDWESSALNAPYITDYVGVFLYFFKFSEANLFLKEFKKWWESNMYGCEFKKIDLMLALAYRLSTGNRDVQSIIQTWK